VTSAGRWFSPGTSVSSTNETHHNDITDILLKVAFNTIKTNIYDMSKSISYQSSNTTDPGSFKLTDISHRLRFSFISFACIVRSFFIFRSFAFRSCNWFVRFVCRSFRSSV
jgi:hypothetical protein